MKRIFKYQLEITDRQTILLPHDAEILSVQVQNQKPCLWAKVDEKMPPEDVQIRIVGTGHEIEDKEADRLSFIGTIQMYGGRLVFHVFKID